MLKDSTNGEPDDSIEKDIVKTLLQYDGLLRSIVQWGFWNFRPDIEKELSADDVAMISSRGLGATTLLLKVLKGMGKVEEIGTTPILSKEYDPNCNVSYTRALIHQILWENGTLPPFKD